MVMESKKNTNNSKKISNGDANESKGLFNEIKSTLKRRSSTQSSQQNEILSPSKALELNDGEGKSEILRNKLALVNAQTCDSPDSGTTTEVEGKQLRRLLLLHLDLIQEQQKQIKEKDKLICKLQSQKEQLESKICRMERRLLVGTKSIAKPSNSDNVKNVAEKERGTKRASLCESTTTRKQKRLPSSTAVTVSSKQFKDISINEVIHTHAHYLHSHMFMPKTEEITKPKGDDIVLVPGWKEVSRDQDSSALHSSYNKTDENEAIQDDAFFRRHQKLETDEKRRKKWDIQRIRQEQFNQTLKQRQKGKESKNPEPAPPEVVLVDSLAPSPGKVSTIEISNQLPVVAFGNSIPSLSTREFDLPWFDVDKKELQLRKQLEKSNSTSSRSRRKTSYF